MSAEIVGAFSLRELIPHAQRMCLLDTILDWDQHTVRCTTSSHRDPLNPLRSGGRLAALHLCEYGAQAAAVHGGLLARQAHGGSAAPGMLAALRAVHLAVERIDDIEDELIVDARQRVGGPGGWLYEFEIRVGSRWLARGRASVIFSHG
ncbi:phosphotransferase [Panacagrimonas sp.]|uniref:phosphotransferase n=1 Tax=Panacagrimonas sp. TaxID=2480088 RepID=UPI003B515558